MLNLKKTAVAVLALGSSAVFAGTMGPVCTPGNVTVPCEKCAWDFGGYALYLEPAYTSPDFTHVPFVFNGSSYRSVNSNPAWGWGFKIEGSYHFNTGNDFNLNWAHWSRSTRNLYTGVVYADGDPLLPVTGERRFGPRWDAVNFEFGQHVDFSEFDSMRLHAGVQYARVKTNVNAGGAAFLATGVAVNPAYLVAARSTFNGFGPRVGADLNYAFGNGFSIYGDGAAAVLVGNSGQRQAVTRVSAAGVGIGAPIGFFGSHRAIVPELEAKLGAKYTYCMGQGDLNLDVGWMWANYFNVNQLRRVAVTAAGVPLPGSLSDTNFGIQGLYFGLKWVGSV